jgi:hypothetical protein
MKKLFLFFVLAGVFASCCKDVSDPNPAYDFYLIRNGDTIKSQNLVNNIVYAGEQISFYANASSEKMIIFTGGPGSNYSKMILHDSLLSKEENSTGQKDNGYSFRKSGGQFVYNVSYANHGVYNVVVVATNVDYCKDIVKNAIDSSLVLTVLDTVASLKSYSFAVPVRNSRVSIADGKIGISVVKGTSMTNCVITLDPGFASIEIKRDELSGWEPLLRGNTNPFRHTIDLTKKVAYRLTALSGRYVEYSVELTYRDADLSTGNSLFGISLDGVDSEIASSSGHFTIIYPKGMSGSKFTVRKSANSIVLFDGIEFTDETTISDLKSAGTITVRSQAGVNREYSYSVTEDDFAVTPFTFSSASGFPVTETEGGDKITVSLGASVNIKTLVPTFPSSVHTVITYADGSPFENGVTAIDFTNPVVFTFVNGTVERNITITVVQ